MTTDHHPAAVPASPVAGTVRIVRAAEAEGAEPGDGFSSVVAVTIDPGEPVFAGHYPDFPIFPGVCVVECVHRGAVATAPGGERLDLAAMESVRFTGAVHPGDDIEITMRWRRADTSWICSARVQGPRAAAAQVRLRYRTLSEMPGISPADRII
jgi:3-hydroxyacyl-[acyl-carrier-protein] dehydratase